jgi:hypothetical protein
LGEDGRFASLSSRYNTRKALEVRVRKKNSIKGERKTAGKSVE